jgi:hypothetical protein
MGKAQRRAIASDIETQVRFHQADGVRTSNAGIHWKFRFGFFIMAP